MASQDLTVRIGANIKDFEKKMNNMQGRMDKIGSGLTKAGAGMTAAVTAPIVGLSTAAFAAANDFDKAYQTIQTGTGATGSELEGLENSFKNVFQSIPVESETASNALASLNTSTGATDSVLEGLSTSVLEASRMMGEDGANNADAFGRAMNQWQVPAEEGENMMDRLFKASQEYGIGLGDNIGNLNEYGSVLQNAGFDMGEAADMFGRLEDGGISVSRVMPGLNMAFRNWSSEGKNAKEEFDNVADSMRNAETDQEALAIATDEFGAEGAQRITTAIRNDIIPSTDELGEALNDSEGAVGDLADETMTVGERFQKMKNRIQTAVEPLGRVFMDILEDLEPAFTSIIGWVEDLGRWFSNLSPTMQNVIVAFGAVAAAAGPVLMVLGSIIGPIAQVVTAFGGVVAVGGAIATAIGKVVGVFAMLLNPVGLVITGITALAGVFIYLWNTNESFRDAVIGIWESIRDTAMSVFSAIGDFLATTWNWISETAVTAWNFIAEHLSNAWNGLMEIVMPIFNGIAEFLSGVWTVITTTAQAAWNVFTTILTAAWNGLMEIVMPIFNSIAEFLSTVWETIRNAATTAWDFISEHLGNAWNWISETAISVFTAVSDFLSNIWTTVSEAATTAWDYISDFLSSTWNSIMEFARPIFDTLSDYFSLIWNTIKDVTSTVWNTISEVLSTVWSMIKDLASGEFNSLGDIINLVWETIKSVTSTVWEGIKSTFSTIVSSIVEFGRNYFSDLRDSISNIFNAISSFFSNIWSTISDTFSSVISSIVSFVQDSWNSLMSTTQDIFNRIMTFLSDTWNDIWSTVTNLADDILSGVTDAWNSLWDSTQDVFNDIMDWVTDKFDDMVEGAKDLPGRIGDAISNAASAAVDGVKSLGNDMAGGLEDVIGGITGGLNDILGAIGIDDLIPDIEIPRFSTGTRNGAIANDGLGMLNDKGPGNGRGGATQELIQRGNSLLAPQGNNAIVGLQKGDKIFNGAETQSLMASGQIPRFSMGTGSEGGNSDDGGIFSGFTDMVSNIWDVITDPSEAFSKLMDTVTPDFSGLSGFAGDMVSGAWNMLTNGIKDFIANIFEDNAAGLGSGSKVSFMDHGVTAGYSPNMPLAGYPTSFNNGHHYGVDYGTPIGTPVHATTGGNVSRMTNEGGGLIAKLKSGELTQFFMHLSSVLESGSVSQGDLIGRTGNSGRWTTGPHIHWQAQQGSDVINQNTVDPRKVVNGHRFGGVFNKRHTAEIAEDGPEAVIPLSASKRGRANQIFDQVGGRIGRGGDDDKEVVDLLTEQNDLLKKQLKKDTNVYMDGQSVNNRMNELDAMRASVDYFS